MEWGEGAAGRGGVGRWERGRAYRRGNLVGALSKSSVLNRKHTLEKLLKVLTSLWRFSQHRKHEKTDACVSIEL